MPNNINFVINDDSYKELESGILITSLDMYEGCYILAETDIDYTFYLIYIENNVKLCTDSENKIKKFSKNAKLKDVKEFIRKIHNDYNSDFDIINNDEYNINFALS